MAPFKKKEKKKKRKKKNKKKTKIMAAHRKPVGCRGGSRYVDGGTIMMGEISKTQKLNRKGH